MIGTVIDCGKNSLAAELPLGTMDIQMRLHSVGVGEPADRSSLSDDEERQLQVTRQKIEFGDGMYVP